MKIQLKKDDSVKVLFEKIAVSINELYDTLDNLGEIQKIDAKTILTSKDLVTIQNDVSDLNSSVIDITKGLENCFNIINSTKNNCDDLDNKIAQIYTHLLSINSSIISITNKNTN